MKNISYVLVILLTMFFSAMVMAQENISETNQKYVADEVIVKFKPEINLKKSNGIKFMQNFASNQELSSENVMSAQNISVMKIEDGQDVMSVIQDLQGDPSVEYVQPNFVYQIEMANPNDTDFGKLRGLKNTGQNVNGTVGISGADIDRNRAMDIFSGNGNPAITGTIVAVIDIGVNYNHIDLINNMWSGVNCLSFTGASMGGCLYGYDSYANDTNPFPNGSDFHGTHIAGIIGAQMNNATGVAGINPNVKIMAIRAGSGNELTTADVAEGFDFAKYNGAKIINASRGLGTIGNCNSIFDQTLYDAIKNFSGLVVASAGNDTREHLNGYFSIPTDYSVTTNCRTGLDNIIGVAATDQNDGLASFSDYGSGTIHVGAPGVNIYSTVLSNGYNYSNGTSMATPHVAGLASLAWSYRPALTYADIKNAIISGGDSLVPLSGKTVSGKRINAYTTLYNLTRPIGSITFLSGNYINTTGTFVRLTTSETGTYQMSGAGMVGILTGNITLTGLNVAVQLTSGDGVKNVGVIFFDAIPKQSQLYTASIILDKTTPTATGSFSTILPTNADVTVTLTGYSESLTGINAISNIFTGNGSFEFTFSDLAGNTGNYTATVTWIDKTGVTGTIAYSTTGLTNQNVMAGITFNKTGVTVNNNSGLTGYLFTNTGTFTFLFTDSYGNTGATTATVTWIDKTAPTGTITLTPSSATSGNVLAVLSGSETLTGQNVTGYIFTGNTSFTFTFSDLAGNTGASTATVTWIDKTAPSIPLLFSPISGTNISGSVNLLWNSSVDTGGMSGYYYELSNDSGMNTLITTGIVYVTGVSINLFSGDTTYYRRVRAFDMLGHTSAFSQTGNFILLWDSRPDAFTISAVSNAELNIQYTSNQITILGINTGSQITIIGGTYQLNSTGDFIPTTGTVYSGDTVKIKLTSSSSYSTVVTATLNIGDITGNYVVTTKAAPLQPSGGGGGGGSPTPTCTATDLVCTSGKYILKTGANCKGGNLGISCTSSASGGIIIPPILRLFTGSQGNISNSPFSLELNAAYLYAYSIGITTMPNILQADMTGTLIRKHLAKMITNFAIKQLGKIPNTGMICYFADMKDETIEMKFYSILACQLGLMGLDTNGVPVQIFSPNDEVNRAQFGTVLSRTLRGNQYNGGDPFYVLHLNALKNAGIMNQIYTPENNELRGWVMLTLMRSVQ